MSDIYFFRRKNPDSTTDLVCLSCFMTVRTTDDEADFALLELLHRCSERKAVDPPDSEDEKTFPGKVLKFLGEREELFKVGSR
jgi:hypothetical protein